MTMSAEHRAGTGSPWLSAVHRGEHTSRRHRASSSVMDRGSPALMIRVVAALAVWCLAFGLFSLTEGWMVGGALALSFGLIALLAIAVAAQASPGGGPPSDPRAPGPRGLNMRRSGYGHST